MSEVKRRLEDSGMMRSVLVSKEGSLDTKRRLKDVEESDASTRRLDAEDPRVEMEFRKQEMDLR